MTRHYPLQSAMLFFVFIVMLALVAVTGCNSTAPAAKPREAPRVTVAHPTIRGLVDEDDYNGWLEASQTVEVRARVRGHIQQIDFKDGDFVEKGQLLFEIDPRPFQAAIDEALAHAGALKAQHVAAQKNAARAEELLKSKAIAPSEAEQIVAEAQSYGARIAAQMQTVERLKLDLEYARLTAPIAGRISRAMLNVGNLVNAGGSDPLLTTIVAIDPIYVDFNVDERAMQGYQEIGARRRGKNRQPAPLREQKIAFSFRLDTEKGFPHQGELIFADNRYTPGTGTIPVRGVAPNSDGRLIPGSRVRVRVPVSDKYEAILVPDTAVNTDQKQKYLLLVGEDKIVKRQNVELGRLLDDGMRVILQPKLGTDAWTITEGMERARLNYPVEPVPETEQPVDSSAR
jgi:membrane fusion protein, multidrug efflux system